MRSERTRAHRRDFASVQLLVGCLLLLQPVLSAQSAERWVGTWATAVVAQAAIPGVPESQGPDVANRTLRQIVHVSLGGDRVRVVLSNTFGTAPLEIGAARIALRAEDAAVLGPSRRPLTFG